VVGIAAHSLLDFNLRIPSNALLAATLAAIAVGSSGVPARRVTGLAAGAWSLALAAGLGLVLLRPVDPWPAAQASAVRAGEGGEPPSALRLELAEQRLREAVASRPALAEAWLLLAWVRAARGEPDAAELASWAVRLEPAREALRREAAQLGAVP
jgi:cytochrome c-type biogenesis protein CcmH/NrfG